MNSESKDTIYYPDLKQSLGLVISLLLTEFLFFLIKKRLTVNNPEWNSLLLMVNSLIVFTIVILLSIRSMRLRNKDEYKLKFTRVGFHPLFIVGLMGLSVAIVASVITRFI